jgi:hypothetical protein
MDSESWLRDYTLLHGKVCESSEIQFAENLAALRRYLESMDLDKLTELLFLHTYGNPKRRLEYIHYLSLKQLYPDRLYERGSKEELFALVSDVIESGVRLQIKDFFVRMLNVTVISHNIHVWHWDATLVISIICKKYMHEFGNTRRMGFNESEIVLFEFSRDFILQKMFHKYAFLRDLMLARIASFEQAEYVGGDFRESFLHAVDLLFAKYPNNPFVLQLIRICFSSNTAYPRKNSASVIVEGLKGIDVESCDSEVEKIAISRELKFRVELATTRERSLWNLKDTPPQKRNTLERRKLLGKQHVNEFK